MKTNIQIYFTQLKLLCISSNISVRLSYSSLSKSCRWLFPNQNCFKLLNTYMNERLVYHEWIPAAIKEDYSSRFSDTCFVNCTVLSLRHELIRKPFDSCDWKLHVLAMALQLINDERCIVTEYIIIYCNKLPRSQYPAQPITMLVLSVKHIYTGTLFVHYRNQNENHNKTRCNTSINFWISTLNFSHMKTFFLSSNGLNSSNLVIV